VQVNTAYDVAFVNRTIKFKDKLKEEDKVIDKNCTQALHRKWEIANNSWTLETRCMFHGAFRQVTFIEGPHGDDIKLKPLAFES
jgi:hypothetical protein